jgi:hypothetical protein
MRWPSAPAGLRLLLESLCERPDVGLRLLGHLLRRLIHRSRGLGVGVAVLVEDPGTVARRLEADPFLAEVASVVRLPGDAQLLLCLRAGDDEQALVLPDRGADRFADLCRRRVRLFRTETGEGTEAGGAGQLLPDARGGASTANSLVSSTCVPLATLSAWATSGRPTNTRMHRARSRASIRRSPLTRHPLGPPKRHAGEC